MDLRKVYTASFSMACILMLLSVSHAQDAYDDKHIAVSLRMIGHQVLLSTGDSSSLVSPIIQEKGRYSIQFESEFEFDPSDMVVTVNRVVAETGLANTYILEVEEYERGEVVYSYEVNRSQKWDIVPCRGRKLPKACYSLVFTVADTMENEMASPMALAGSSPGTSSMTSQLKYGLAIMLFVLLAGGGFFVWKKRKSPAINPDLIPLGKYQFDKLHTELLYEQQRIELSSKEADLLLLLYNELNTTVEREVILNRVWGDEGDYVGRTLDVFISKLRKKLNADSNVKIVNIRGVGYKLVVGG